MKTESPKLLFHLKVIYIFVGVLFGIVCIFLGITIEDILDNSLSPFQFDGKVSIDTISNTILTFLIVFFINRKINNKRIEKDLLIEMCKDHANLLDSIKDSIELIYIESKNKQKLSKLQADTILIKIEGLSNSLLILIENVKSKVKNNKAPRLMEQLKQDKFKFWYYPNLGLGGKNPSINNSQLSKMMKSYISYKMNLTKLMIIINDI